MSELANDREYALVIARRYFYDRNVTLDVVVETFADTAVVALQEINESRGC